MLYVRKVYRKEEPVYEEAHPLDLRADPAVQALVADAVRREQTRHGEAMRAAAAKERVRCAVAEQRGREEGRASVLDIACLCHSVIQTAKCKYPDDFGAWSNDQRTCLLGLGEYIDEHIHPTETDR